MSLESSHFGISVPTSALSSLELRAHYDGDPGYIDQLYYDVGLRNGVHFIAYNPGMTIRYNIAAPKNDATSLELGSVLSIHNGKLKTTYIGGRKYEPGLDTACAIFFDTDTAIRIRWCDGRVERGSNWGIVSEVGENLYTWVSNNSIDLESAHCLFEAPCSSAPTHIEDPSQIQSWREHPYYEQRTLAVTLKSTNVIATSGNAVSYYNLPIGVGGTLAVDGIDLFAWMPWNVTTRLNLQTRHFPYDIKLEAEEETDAHVDMGQRYFFFKE
jgi:hypothetical protein